MISIQTNVNSLIAQQNLSVTSAFQSKTIAQLTSGYRINQSGDDAAGLAVANKFRSTVAELTQGVANGNDATAQLQIMDGGMSNISSILDRLKTLATQSASGTFTGSRTTLNSEFQNDITEIDRQAQSIGLNSGGTFAQSLSVYLGQGSGSASLANAQVGLDLSSATVDSQSLGLKGMQAVVGTADLGSSSSTSVANILGDTTNKAAVAANLGDTVFDFSGAGFSGLQVTVNPTGVTDLNGLVANINSAIQNAGSGTATGAAAFKAAGIVASVHTDASGGQQIAFTSATSAFQVSAGDRMANALMGNFSSGATGASLNTTVTGQDTYAGALVGGKTINVQVSGDGFTTQTIQLSTTTYGTGALAAADLMSEINTGLTSGGGASAAGAALKAAGISVALGGVSSNQLIFTNANNAKFQVQVSGDTGTVSATQGNVLGLGASVSGGAGVVTYSTITAGNAYANTGAAAQVAQAQTTLEFAVAGGPAVALGPIALDGGDATGGTNISDAISSNGMVLASDTKFSFTLDNATITTGVLTASLNAGAAVTSGTAGTAITTPVTTDYTPWTASTGAGGGVANATALTTDYSLAVANNTFLASYNGQVKTITLASTGAATTAGVLASNLQATLRAAFGGTTDITVTNSGGKMVVSTVAAGAGESLSFAAATGSSLLGDLGITAATYHGKDGNNGNNMFVVNVNGVSHNVVLSANDSGADTTALLTDIRNGLNNALIGAAQAGGVLVSLNAAGKLVFTTKDTGLNESISVAAAYKNDGSLDTTLNDLGLTGIGGTLYKGDAKSAANIASAINTAIQNAELATDPTTGKVGALYGSTWTSGTTDAAKATVDPTTGAITITNNAVGADHTLSKVQQQTWNGTVWSGTADSSLWAATAGGTLLNSSGGVAHGANRTLDNLVSAINAEVSGNTALTAAGITAANTTPGVPGGSLKFYSTNSTKFQLNAGAAAAAGTVIGTVDVTSGMDFSKAPVTLNLSTDGGVTTHAVVLNQEEANASAILSDLSTGLVGSGATANLVSVNGKNYIQIAETAVGPTHSLQIQSGTANAVLGLTAGTYAGANEVDLGFGAVSGQSFAGLEGINGGTSTLTGVSASGTAQTGGLSFTAIGAGLGTQSLAIAANDSHGVAQAVNITLAGINSGTVALANDGTASSIDKAVTYINKQLQATNNATLQSIVAVEQNVNGSPAINLISSASNFQVSVGSNASAGINLGKAETVSGAVSGTGSTIAIDTQAGAQAAVTALATAVGKLGAAQGAIGRGENQLGYAVSLAQSQITNFSAAESQIRDANVAQQAANLSKAQVLSQASIAAMAQANSAPQAVLSLLRG
jgi:flagellin